MVDILSSASPLEAIRQWWRERVLLRNAYGNPALTKAVTFLDLMAKAVSVDKSEEGKELAARLLQIRDNMVHGGASERGWAMDRDIAAIEAATAKPQLPQGEKKS